MHIARYPAVFSALALPAQGQNLSVVHAARNININAAIFSYAPRAAARCALGYNLAPRSATIWAGIFGHHLAKHRVLRGLNNARPAAPSTRLKVAIFSARAVTVCARFISRYVNSFFTAKRRLNKRQRHFNLNICALGWAISSSATATKSAAKSAKNVTENVAKAAKIASIKATRAATKLRASCAAVRVIILTLLFIAKHFVGLVDLF